MAQLPDLVIAFLKSDDALTRAQLRRDHPELTDVLQAPSTREGILTWLQEDEAWTPAASLITLNALELLRTGASETEATIIRPFLLHSDRRVRLAAYEFLRVLYYPDKNPEAMNQLYQNMLMDDEDAIRTQAARYLMQAHTQTDLVGFLERWLKAAPARGWESTESYQQIKQLVHS